jgi:acetate kinase
MKQGILTINAGSSSIKFALFPAGPPDFAGSRSFRPDRRHRHRCHQNGRQEQGRRAHCRPDASPASGQPRPGTSTPCSSGSQPPTRLANRRRRPSRRAWRRPLLAADHRSTPGARHLTSFIPLAPLHQPHNVAGIIALQAAAERAARSPASTPPSTAASPKSPRCSACRARHRRRHQALRLPRPVLRIHRPRPAAAFQPRHGRVVVAHLGNGASMAAMVGRKCLATTLGFSTIDGLMMGTRCGNLDPGVMLHLMETKGLASRK